MFRKIIILVFCTVYAFCATIPFPVSVAFNPTNMQMGPSGLTYSNMNYLATTNIAIGGKSYMIFDTLSAMTNYSVTNFVGNAIVNIKGRNAINDGSGGTFVYNSSATNTVDFGVFFPVIGGSGRWVKQYSGKVNVKWFGAVNDQVTDNTGAFTNCVAYLRSVATPRDMYIPAGTYRISAGFNLTGLDGNLTNTGFTVSGDGKYTTLLLAAQGGGTIFDLSGSSRVTLKDFGIRKWGGLQPAQIILCARNTNNASAGDNVFQNLYIAGETTNALCVLWGSEQNNFDNVSFFQDNDAPCLVESVKISDVLSSNSIPTSLYMTLGTGEGGVGMNTFYGCRFDNDTGNAATNPAVKVFGSTGTLFSGCYFINNSTNTVWISTCSYPTDPASVYYPTVTFDTCLDENAWGNATKNSIYIPPFPTNTVGSLKTSVKGLDIRNSAFFRVYAATNTIVSGLTLSGGRNSPSFGVGAGVKASFDYLYNSKLNATDDDISGSNDFVVRRGGSRLEFRGVASGHLLLTNVVGYTAFDDQWNFTLDKNLNSSGYGIFGSSSPIGWYGRSQLLSTTDGEVVFLNQGNTNFTVARFGGTGTNSTGLWFGTTPPSLSFKTADGSSFIGIKSLYDTYGSGVPSALAPIGTVYHRLDGGVGTSLYINQNNTTNWDAINPSGEVNTITNMGSGLGVYNSKTGVALGLNTLTGGTNITIVSNANSLIISYIPVTNCTTIAISDTTSTISSGAGKQYWNAPYNATLKDIRATLYTVSSSGIVTVNVKKNGTTIFTTKLTIDASEETSDTAATPYVFSTTAITKADKLTFDIDGAGTGAVNLQVQLYYTK